MTEKLTWPYNSALYRTVREIRGRDIPNYPNIREGLTKPTMRELPRFKIPVKPVRPNS